MFTAAVIVKLLCIIILIPLDIILVVSFLRGAPFAVTNSAVARQMIKLTQLRLGERAVDLGSGDGRLVIALAQAGAQAVGYEMNPLLVVWSRYNIKKAGVENRAHIYWRSFWREDLSSYQVVTLFGMTHIMAQLEQKLQHELKLGARVICNTYRFPNWKPVQTKERMFVYQKD